MNPHLHISLLCHLLIRPEDPSGVEISPYVLAGTYRVLLLGDAKQDKMAKLPGGGGGLNFSMDADNTMQQEEDDDQFKSSAPVRFPEHFLNIFRIFLL